MLEPADAAELAARLDSLAAAVRLHRDLVEMIERTAPAIAAAEELLAAAGRRPPS